MECAFIGLQGVRSSNKVKIFTDQISVDIDNLSLLADAVQNSNLENPFFGVRGYYGSKQ